MARWKQPCARWMEAAKLAERLGRPASERLASAEARFENKKQLATKLTKLAELEGAALAEHLPFEQGKLPAEVAKAEVDAAEAETLTKASITVMCPVCHRQVAAHGHGHARAILTLAQCPTHISGRP